MFITPHDVTAGTSHYATTPHYTTLHNNQLTERHLHTMTSFKHIITSHQGQPHNVQTQCRYKHCNTTACWNAIHVLNGHHVVDYMTVGVAANETRNDTKTEAEHTHTYTYTHLPPSPSLQFHLCLLTIPTLIVSNLSSEGLDIYGFYHTMGLRIGFSGWPGCMYDIIVIIERVHNAAACVVMCSTYI